MIRAFIWENELKILSQKTHLYSIWVNVEKSHDVRFCFYFVRSRRGPQKKTLNCMAYESKFSQVFPDNCSNAKWCLRWIFWVILMNQVLIVSFNVSDKNVFMYFVNAMVLWNVGGASICATIKIKSLRMSHISIN